MRAVALSDKSVQEKVAQSFIPLKVTIKPGTKEFPLSWPAMLSWGSAYRTMGGEKNEGFTGCSVISPDLQVEYGNTGSALVWEMFDSPAYDAQRFAAMLDRARGRWVGEQEIHSDNGLSEGQRQKKLESFRAEVRNVVGKEGRFHLPPRGFTIQGAVKLFEMSGDLPQKK